MPDDVVSRVIRPGGVTEPPPTTVRQEMERAQRGGAEEYVVKADEGTKINNNKPKEVN